MSHILKNKQLEIHIDLPLEGYAQSRFDWTGKIVKVLFENRQLSSVERPEWEQKAIGGKGFYNEFGMRMPVGYAETAPGEWFHKIGVGLLKKEDDQYIFNKNHELQAAQFSVFTEPGKLMIRCTSDVVNGYAYVLEKEIEALEDGFIISYHLQNTGEKAIITDEYSHNFLAINKALIGQDYVLKFPFPVDPNAFGETVNPEDKVMLHDGTFTFRGTPEAQFFFSNLSGGKLVDAGWELTHASDGIGIRETASFQTQLVNLWGWGHVISPELFVELDIQPGHSRKWSRRFDVFHLR